LERLGATGGLLLGLGPLGIVVWLESGVVTTLLINEQWLAWEVRTPFSTRLRRCPMARVARVKVEWWRRSAELHVFCTRGVEIRAFRGCAAADLDRAMAAIRDSVEQAKRGSRM